MRLMSFLPRDAILARYTLWPCVDPSVRLSVRRSRAGKRLKQLKRTCWAAVSTDRWRTTWPAWRRLLTSSQCRAVTPRPPADEYAASAAGWSCTPRRPSNDHPRRRPTSNQTPTGAWRHVTSNDDPLTLTTSSHLCTVIKLRYVTFD